MFQVEAIKELWGHLQGNSSVVLSTDENYADKDMPFAVEPSEDG